MTQNKVSSSYLTTDRKNKMFKNKNPLQQPLFPPDSSWTPPELLPDLSKAKEIAVDLETWDPNLKQKGAGWCRGDGEIVGVAVAVDGWSGYLPIRHRAGGNLDENLVFTWLKKALSTEAKKICHNASYDIGWLKREGIDIKGQLIDTMVAAPLIDENRFSYALNALGKEYLKEKKDENLLRDAAEAWGVDAKADLYQLPPMYVGPYAEQDAELTLKLWNWQKSELTKQDLWSIFDLEVSIVPLLIEMRWRGVRVDLQKAEDISKKFLSTELEHLQKIKKIVNQDVDIWANASIAKAFDKISLKYGYTEKGSPTFQQHWLEHHEHELPRAIVQARKMNKARTTFIDGMIMGNQVDGRIHAELHSLRSDDGGTVTGRFSYSNPNLQQVPAREPNIGPLIRSLFIPEEGCEWGAFDYSQQEPRLVVHYADMMELPEAGKAVHAFKTEDADFHQIVADMAEIPRKQAKNINLGLFYSMGVKKLSESLGLTLDEGKALFAKYHQRVPFVKALSDRAVRRASIQGNIRTLLGRRCRFDKWEPSQFGTNKIMDHKTAYAEHGNAIKRAFTHKAMNRLIQGSAADMTKKAMQMLHAEGIVPHLQVHDELDISVSSSEQIGLIKEIMETCVEIRVPIKVDVEVGPNWGDAKDINKVVKHAESVRGWTRGAESNYTEQH
jgi:DNA polymerase I-like protein with 3'-5' exonuclease and polymerase domains